MKAITGTGAHVAHVLPWRHTGGTEMATLRLIQAAAHHGHAATAFHLGDADPVRELFRAHGLPTQAYASPTPSYRAAFPFAAESARLARQFTRSGVDLVHCADVAAAFRCSLAARLAGIPVITHVRNRYRVLPGRLRPLLRLLRHFVFVSRQTWADFAYPVPEARGSVVYDGIAPHPPLEREVALDLRQQLGIPAQSPLVGMVARVHRQKDFGTLAMAAAQLLPDFPTVRFLIVGDYQADAHREYYRELQALLASLGLRDHFVFTGQRSDVHALMGTCDVFALSTHWEGFPLVILEAMAVGLPVVATAVDGIPEVVRAHESGLLVPPADPTGLAAALRLLLQDRRLASRLGQQGRALVATEFSESRYVEAIGSLYERVLTPASRRPSRVGAA